MLAKPEVTSAITGAEGKCFAKVVGKTKEIPYITAEAVQCCSHGAIEKAKENHTHKYSKYESKSDSVVIHRWISV